MLTTAAVAANVTSLSAALGFALRCDVAAKLEPLGVTFAQITLTGQKNTKGVESAISIADPDISAWRELAASAPHSVGQKVGD